MVRSMYLYRLNSLIESQTGNKVKFTKRNREEKWWWLRAQ
jgi:hypothetical protein